MNIKLFAFSIASLILIPLDCPAQATVLGARYVCAAQFLPSTSTYADAAISAAIATLPPEGGVIDARCLDGSKSANNLTFHANPFPNSNLAVHLLLGAADYQIQVPIVINTSSQMIGLGRGVGLAGGLSGSTNLNNDGVAGTASKPAALISMGYGAPAYGIQIENLNISCGAPSASYLNGIENQYAEERSWVRNVSIFGCSQAALYLYSSGAQNSGPYNDLEILSAQTGATCITVYGVPSFRGIYGVTCNLGGPNPVGIGVGESNGVAEDIHCEGLVDCVNVGNPGLGIGVVGQASFTVSNVYGQPSVTNVVHIQSSRGVNLFGLTTGGALHLIDDGSTSPDTIINDSDIGFYMDGFYNGNPSRLTSSPSLASVTLVNLSYSQITSGLFPASPGMLAYCTNCQAGTTPCTGTGSGALALYQGGVWSCK